VSAVHRRTCGQIEQGIALALGDLVTSDALAQRGQCNEARDLQATARRGTRRAARQAAHAGDACGRDLAESAARIVAASSALIDGVCPMPSRERR
jgi:hypothetical protein